MNAQRIFGLAAAIELTQRSFHMSKWLQADTDTTHMLGLAATHGTDALVAEAERCQTFACIAGWAVLLYGDDDENRPFHTTYEYARQLLELSEEEARKLFHPRRINWPEPREIDCHYNDVTPAYAARVLRHFASTGVVNWFILNQSPPASVEL